MVDFHHGEQGVVEGGAENVVGAEDDAEAVQNTVDQKEQDQQIQSDLVGVEDQPNIQVRRHNQLEKLN